MKKKGKRNLPKGSSASKATGHRGSLKIKENRMQNQKIEIKGAGEQKGQTEFNNFEEMLDLNLHRSLTYHNKHYTSLHKNSLSKLFVILVWRNQGKDSAPCASNTWELKKIITQKIRDRSLEERTKRTRMNWEKAFNATCYFTLVNIFYSFVFILKEKRSRNLDATHWHPMKTLILEIHVTFCLKTS